MIASVYGLTIESPMTYFFFNCFKSKTAKPKIMGEAHLIIAKVQESIANRGEKKQSGALIELINQRQAAFITQINKTKKESERQKFINSYFHFASTIDAYIKNPTDIHDVISTYHGSSDYIYVGGEKGEFSYSFADKAASHLVKLGLLMLGASLITLPFSLLFGLIGVGISLIILGPSLFYVLAESLPNQANVKKEEHTLFIAAQELINPDNNEGLTNDTEGPHLEILSRLNA